MSQTTLTRILTEKQQPLLSDERRQLSSLQSILLKLGASAENLKTLERCIAQLDELFLLVVVGEFNSGKSAFINALLGQKILDEGVTPTTAQVNILRHGETVNREILEEDLHSLSAPVDLLREIHIVDTPGTNAIIRKHEAITTDFVPRSDLVLFVTSADHPFTETERAFLEQIRNWGKKVVVVINKIDILAPAEMAQVERFVAEHSRALLGITPEIFPVSARSALRAKKGEPGLWQESGFESLENYIRETLDETGRLRLKLLSPLGVAQHLVEKYLADVRNHLEVLKDDVATIEELDRHLSLYETDMAQDFGFRMADIDKTLLEMEQRGHAFFDETLRIGRFFDLLNRSRIRQAFEQQVVGDTPQQVERRVNELIDWLVDADLRQWQSVTNHLAERRRQYRDRIIGDSESSNFLYDRSRLIESVGRETQRVVESYDRTREAQSLAEGARTAVAAAAAVGAGALGLGTLVTIVATTAAADVTGIIMAGAMAAIGFFIIPAKRSRAKEEIRRKITSMRENLARSLRAQFEQEISRSSRRIRDGVAPYTRFVRAEREKLTAAQSDLERIQTDFQRLKLRIESL